MIADTAADRLRGRAVFAAAIIALHIALAVIVTRSQPTDYQPAAVAVMTVVEVPAAPQPQPQPAPMPVPREVDLPLPGVDIVTPAAAPAQACDVLAQVGVALQADAAVASTLLQVPSEAPAVMAWNGQWSPSPDNTAIKRTIVATLPATRADCLDEPMTGPRLVFLAGKATTVSVAIGSGHWRWRELLSSD